MHCRAGFDNGFVIDNLNKSWYAGEYRTKRKETLWDRERARLPEAMEVVEREVQADKLLQRAADARKKQQVLRKLVREMAREEAALVQAAEAVRGGSAARQKNAFTFIMGCSHDDCRGYLNPDYSCKLCDRKTCPECLTPVNDDSHVCDKEALATAALLRKATKPCPGCGEAIQKTDGCDQMWCLSCHTAFSWRTGAIERGAIHNPEYYRWQRENGGRLPRERGDEVCGGLVGVRHLLDLCGDACPRPLLDEISTCHQLVQHVTHVELPQAREACRNNADTEPVRVRYLKGEIDKEEASAIVERSDRTRARHARAVDAWELVATVGADLFRKLADDLTTRENSVEELLIDFFHQMEKLCAIANKPLLESLKGTSMIPRKLLRAEGCWRIIMKNQSTMYHPIRRQRFAIKWE